MKIEIMDPEDCLVVVDPGEEKIYPGPGCGHMGVQLEVEGRSILWTVPVDKITYPARGLYVEVHLEGIDEEYKTVNIPRKAIESIRIGLDCVFIEIDPMGGML